MRFSSSTEYGIRALVHLAENGDGTPCSLAVIADKEGLSFSYLEKIFGQLRKAKIVISQKGANGGYTLARPVEKISLREVCEALGESLTPCDRMVKQESSPQLHCKSHLVWAVVQKNMLSSLDKLYLKDIINQ